VSAPRYGDTSPGFREQRFDAGEVSINYAEGPENGPPLVLLHGIGRRWQIFLSLLPTLSRRWHVYALDFRGHGKSGRVARGYHGTQYGKDVVRFLEKRVAAPAVIYGHSLGGMVGMWIAANYPHLVRALILGDNVMDPATFWDSMYPEFFGSLRDLALRGGTTEEIAHGLAALKIRVPTLDEPIALGDLPGNDLPYLRWWAGCIQGLDPDTFNMSLDGSSWNAWDSDALLRSIKCPTLLLQASEELGGLMSDEDVQKALQLLSDGRHVEFPTLGHALHLQQAEPVLRAITEFLDTL
jgi:pimeloyl-ACP methyl ester carboxylesterase